MNLACPLPPPTRTWRPCEWPERDPLTNPDWGLAASVCPRCMIVLVGIAKQHPGLRRRVQGEAPGTTAFDLGAPPGTLMSARELVLGLTARRWPDHPLAVLVAREVDSW